MLKTVSSVANALGALNYKGTWNANTNTPTLASGVGTQGDYYVVSVAGATNLDGITNWGVGDWAAFNGSVWQRVEGGADGNFVNLGVTGTTTLDGPLNLNSATGPVLNLKNTDTNGNSGEYVGKIEFEGSDASGGAAGVRAGVYAQYGSDFGFTSLDFQTAASGGAASSKMQIDGNGSIYVMNGNVIMNTSGQGIDFSATAQAPGSTSELLDDYEEGTWTPIDSSGAGLTFAASSGSYTKVGRMVMATGYVNFPVTANGSGNKIGGLPFTNIDSTSRGVGAVNYKQVADVDTLLPENNATTFFFATATGSVTTNAQISNTAVYFGLVYTAS
tara:strand:- start:1134 stop:2126 length:993 start_codon:yes stop_codon:yes gene_type:complete